MRNKVVVVTGGAAGIGRATAARFTEAGAKVVICDVNQEMGDDVARSLGHDAAFYKVNVASKAEVRAFVEQVVARHGRIDVLVNNAGIAPVPPSLLDVTEDLFDKTIAVNLRGPLRLTALAVVTNPAIHGQCIHVDGGEVMS